MESTFIGTATVQYNTISELRSLSCQQTSLGIMLDKRMQQI